MNKGKSKQPIGKQFSICSICGEEFEQELNPKTNRYSARKLCPRCRKDPTEKKINVATINYSPFPWQQEAEEAFEKHKYLILACGARTGKDRFSNMMLIKYLAQIRSENRHIHKPNMIPPYRFWSIAPTYDLVDQNFRELKKNIPKEWIKSIKESSVTIEMKDGGVVQCKSAYDIENLVGVGLDFCTITEADRIRDLQSVWANIVMRLVSPGCGREIDRHGQDYGAGKAIINSSPTGKNFLYQMYQWGQPDYDYYDTDFISMNLPSYANPLVKQELERVKKTKYGEEKQIDALRRQMTPERFARDVLGEFVDDTGIVFSDFDKCVIDTALITTGKSREEMDNFIKEFKKPKSGGIYRIGYDPATGSSADTPAVVVRDMISNNIVWVQGLWGKNYDQQWDEISLISKRYNYAPCCWLRTGHTAIENQLVKRGVQEIPLNEQGGKKAEYVQSLERAVQNMDIHIIDDGTKDNSTLIRQMNDYTEKNGKYSNSFEAHDDFVSALYAVYYDYSVKEMNTDYFSSLISGF